MIRMVLLCLAAGLVWVGTASKARATCDDRFINSCDTRSWHTKTKHKSEFKTRKHAKATLSHKFRQLARKGHRVARHAASVVTEAATQIVEHPHGCPRSAFCGCGTAVKIFGAPIRALWLAAAWFRYPPAEPAPGMVAVRRSGHHVFAILRVIDRTHVLAYDPNSGGHLTRIHVVPLYGYSVRNPHGRA